MPKSARANTKGFILQIVLDYLATPLLVSRRVAANQIEGPVFAIDGVHDQRRTNIHRALILKEELRLSGRHHNVASLRRKIGQAMKIPYVGLKIVPERSY